jgi:hypothetical protein|tara:strand:+ start:1358 stop:1780 length:423 start_codon:yes stop_codon:yes gene_type:complete
MMDDDKKTAGSCQCGAVRFEVSGPFESFFLCHCNRCRKDTGSAHAANLFSSTATIDWLAGQDAIRTYRMPNTLHQKSFCSQCGSAVPNVQMNGGLLVVPAGSLDDAVEIRPDAHICFASRAEWDNPGDVPTLDGLPGQTR